MFSIFGKKKDKTITARTLVGDVLSYDPGIADVLMQSGMHCIACPSARHESLEMACLVHGLDVNSVVADLNRYMAEKQ